MRTRPTRWVRFAAVLAGAAACATTGAWRSTPLETSAFQARVVTAAVDPAGELELTVDVVNAGAGALIVAPRDCVAFHADGPRVALDTTHASAAPVVLAPGASEEIQLVFRRSDRAWQPTAVFVVLATDSGQAAVRAPPLRIDWQ